MNTFDLLVTAHSNRDLKQAMFDRQVDMIRPLMNWDPAGWSRRGEVPGAR